MTDDLFGRALWAYYQTAQSEYYVRREDNIGVRDSLARYFRPWEELAEHQRCLLGHARGHVLDVGAGAGQHSLALQERGLEVTAIDRSPFAVEVCRARGVRDVREMDVQAMTFDGETFDSVLLLGNNIGIAGELDGLRKLFTNLRDVVRPGGQLLADFNDYSATRNPADLRYHQWNIARGRYPGAISIRIEYDGNSSPFFNWLAPKLSDLRRIAGETGWKVTRCVQVLVD